MNFFARMLKRRQWARLPEEKKRQLLAEAVELLKLDPEAYELLKMAQADGVEIKFSSELTGSKTSAQHVLNSGTQKQYIEICPHMGSGELKTPGKIATDLAHELRHYWQYKQLGVTPQNRKHINRSPRLAFIFNRVIEADAYAFRDRFVDTVNENFRSFAEMAEKLLKLQQSGRKPSADEIEMASLEITRKFRQFCAENKNYLKNEFMEYLKSKSLSDSYDPEGARYLHLFHTSWVAEKTDFDAVKHIPELTLADIRKVLKSGVTQNAPGYLDEMSDDQFEELVLSHAHQGALEAVSLMEKFRAAAASNDNQTAKILRRQVKKKIRKL